MVVDEFVAGEIEGREIGIIIGFCQVAIEQFSVATCKVIELSGILFDLSSERQVNGIHTSS
jgi:hypothetical protein